MNDPAAANLEVADALARVMSLAAEKSAGFVTQLHPAWVDSIWPGASGWMSMIDGVVPQSDTRRALLAAWGFRWPSLGALDHRLNRVALLPALEVRSWLCTAALFLCRREVRRCVQRTQRQRLVQMVGSHAIDMIAAAPESGPTPLSPPPLSSASTQELAVWAYCQLSAQRAWTNEDARRLIGLSLPPVANAVEPDGGIQQHHVFSLDGFSDQLPAFFPKYSWLFGSSTDVALSA